MSQTKLEAVLEKIIALTSEKDSGALELTLAQTLFALADIKDMVMYSAGNINRTKFAISNAETVPDGEPVPEELVDDLVQCLETVKITNIRHLDKQLTLFPLMCSQIQPLAVIVLEETADTRNHDLAIQILKIFHNVLALMNENERDTLTGLLNRKTFDHKINAIITERQNNQNRRKNDNEESAYLAIFDIDHFKRVNDTHGHLIGDEVLLLFSRLMDKGFRDADLLFRFGGEEFVGLFYCPEDTTMSAVLNRFREIIAQYNFPQVGHITVSGGFTRITPLDLSSNIIGRADAALYHAKNNGRNQIAQHETLVSTGVISEDQNESSGDVELF